MSDYENPWLFDRNAFTTEDIGKFEGFVYLIVDTKNKKKYIGRKYFWNIRKVKGKTKRQRSESDWKDYYGSSKELQEQVSVVGKDNFERHILSLHMTRGDCNRTEVELQWKLDVLYRDDWYNGTIGNYRSIPDDIHEKRKTSDKLKELL